VDWPTYASSCRASFTFSLCFSQPKPASQQYFSLTKNQHQPAQTSTSTNQRTDPLLEGLAGIKNLGPVLIPKIFA